MSKPAQWTRFFVLAIVFLLVAFALIVGLYALLNPGEVLGVFIGIAVGAVWFFSVKLFAPEC